MSDMGAFLLFVGFVFGGIAMSSIFLYCIITVFTKEDDLL